MRRSLHERDGHTPRGGTHVRAGTHEEEINDQKEQHLARGEGCIEMSGTYKKRGTHQE